MEYRARTRPMLRRAGLLAALSALLVPAVAGTSHAATRSPVVKSVAPKQVFVGQTLTLRGKNFRRGLNKNVVAFKRRGAKVMFVRAGKATTRLLQVAIPKRLEKAMVVQNGTRVPTPLQVRVLAARFGKAFTSLSMSPVVGPERPLASPRLPVVGSARVPVVGSAVPPVGSTPPPAPPAVKPDGDCDGDGVPNRVDTDDDNDLLTDTLEQSLKLNPCLADTDGDTVEDGYEYQSARDLNDDEDRPNSYVPYPGKKPYPNPLDGRDANTDHDGDDLSLLEEYKLWKYTTDHGSPRTLDRLTYSAGEQYSVSARDGGGSRKPTLRAADYSKQADFLDWASRAGYRSVELSPVTSTNWWEGRATTQILDMDRSGTVSPAEALYYDVPGGGAGWLDDSERDEDADGLSNWMETRGCMNRGYWDSLYSSETPYYLSYSETLLDDADTDGDGVRDGADDQDHDDVPNLMECSRELASGGFSDPGDATGPPEPTDGRPPHGMVNPYNPCLPHPYSRTCKRIVPISGAWAPFTPGAKYYVIKN